MVMVKMCVRVGVGGDEPGGDAWAVSYEERGADEVDEVGRGAFKVRKTALVDRIGTLTA